MENNDGSYTKTKSSSMVLGNFSTINPEFLVTKIMNENERAQVKNILVSLNIHTLAIDYQ